MTHANALTVNSGVAATLEAAAFTTLEQAGAVTGVGSLTKSGLGTVTLSGGPANTFTGPINVNAGILGSLNSASLQSVTSAITVASGATFDAKAFYGASIANNFTLSGTGSGIFNYGALNIRENANLAGAITLAADTKIIHDWNIAYVNASITGTDTNTNLELQTLQTSQYGFFMNGAINLGIGSLTLNGIGTSGCPDLKLSGNNTFTGGLIINNGVVQLDSTGALNSTAGSENAVTFGASSTGKLALNGRSYVIANLASNATPGSPVVENGNATAVTLTVGNSQNLSGTYAGVIQDGAGGGALSLTKSGTGTFTLRDGANSYTGGTTVSQGTLALGNDYFNNQNGTALGTGAVTVTGGAQLRLGGAGGGAVDFTVGNAVTLDNGTIFGNDGVQHLTGGLTVAAGGGSLFVNWGGKDISLEGAVAGPGTLAINNQAGQGNGAVVFATGGTIGGLTGSGFAKVSSGQTLAVGSNGANTTFSGNLDGGGAITKTGTGTLALTGTNYYSGSTTISGGILSLGASEVLPDVSTVVLNGGTLLTGHGFTETAGALSLTNSSIIDLGGVSGIGGTSILTFTGGSGLSAANTLQIWNWNGTAMTGGGSERLVIPGLSEADLAYVSFYSGAGGTSLGTAAYATLGGNELVPVPEPSALLSTLAMMGRSLFRRRRQS
jgi:fibronectin-binding autotransporter adhesin